MNESVMDEELSHDELLTIISGLYDKIDSLTLERDHWKQEFKILNKCEKDLLSLKLD